MACYHDDPDIHQHAPHSDSVRHREVEVVKGLGPNLVGNGANQACVHVCKQQLKCTRDGQQTQRLRTKG
jgi:hypothetical protein